MFLKKLVGVALITSLTLPLFATSQMPNADSSRSTSQTLSGGSFSHKESRLDKTIYPKVSKSIKQYTVCETGTVPCDSECVSVVDDPCLQANTQ